MKRVFVVAVLLTGVLPAFAQETRQPAVSGERLFFPRNVIWAWAQFDIAPPHNEVDPNLCAANAGNYGGKDAPCNAFARYMLSGYVEFRPFARTPLRRLMFFGAPTFLFGKNVPQTLYTWSWDGIGWERSWGLGIDFGRGFEMRVTQHFLFQRFGARDRYLGPADLGLNGPWGRYNAFGVRKYFGRREP
ncbi:MAG TPA: hypothetical protein VEI01_21915 [Terriglobales bacterium]|nr:hypothetical protein [Terriglobales bacterium]